MQHTILRVPGDASFPSYLNFAGTVDEPDAAPVARQDVSLEALADLCDRAAESRNVHAFVGAHRLLAALLYRELGRDRATDVLWRLATLGGLDRASGAGADPEETAWAELGVPDSNAEAWHLGADA